MEKKINYLARSFNDIKSELIGFSKKYYPEISDNFNDASVGSWFIDLVSAVGDNLSYHTDRMYQENNINSANLKSSVFNNARLNGVKIPGPKASMCEVELSCVLPADITNISSPQWQYAPIVKLGSIVGNNNYQFELTEDVDFRTQFNNDGISNRKFTPNRDNNGVITGYTITKSTIVVGGKNKIYKKVLTDDDIKPFMEIVLPEQNIMNIESIIFKESSNFNSSPQSYEYYIDEEQFKFKGQEIDTYRFFEVDSLSDQFIFGKDNGNKTEFNNDYLEDCSNNPNQSYEDYTETVDGEPSSKRTRRYFKGKWKPITQKFITEYTDNGYLKIIFGCGNELADLDDKNGDYTQYGKHMMTKILNNNLLGILPKAGWTMFVLYRTSGGIETNLAQGAINSVLNANVSFSNLYADKMMRSKIVSSLTVNNITPSVGGRDFPSIDEIKNFVKYSVQEQKRCVTVKDYKTRIMMIPPKFGCPFRCNSIEDNNKILIPCLGLNSKGKLDEGLADIIKNNIIEYLSHYKTIGDYVELKSGKIYHLGFEVDIFVDKNYNTSDVVKKVINQIKEYMDVNKHEMGEDIFIGDLEKDINLIDGVVNLIDLRIFSIYDGDYSTTPSPLPKAFEYGDNCQKIESQFIIDDANAKSFQIDLMQTDNVLYSDYDSMYEILNPESDIKIRTKIK